MLQSGNLEIKWQGNNLKFSKEEMKKKIILKMF